MCAITSKTYGWDLRNIAKISQKFFKTVHAIRAEFVSVVLHHIRILCVQCQQPHMTDSSESEGKSLMPAPLPHMRLWLSILSEFLTLSPNYIVFC